MKAETMVQSVWDHVGKNFNSVYKPLGVLAFCAVITTILVENSVRNNNKSNDTYIRMMDSYIETSKDNAESFKKQAKASSEIAAGVTQLKDVADRQRQILERSEENDRKQMAYWEETRNWQKENLTTLKANGEQLTKAQAIGHEERVGFWEPAKKQMAEQTTSLKEQGADMKKILESGKVREKIQADILAESKRRCDAEEKHAKDVEDLIKGKTPQSVPAKQ